LLLQADGRGRLEKWAMGIESRAGGPFLVAARILPYRDLALPLASWRRASRWRAVLQTRRISLAWIARERLQLGRPNSGVSGLAGPSVTRSSPRALSPGRSWMSCARPKRSWPRPARPRGFLLHATSGDGPLEPRPAVLHTHPLPIVRGSGASTAISRRRRRPCAPPQRTTGRGSNRRCNASQGSCSIRWGTKSSPAWSPVRVR